MWPRRQTNNQIQIVCSADHLHCFWLHQNNPTKKTLLRARKSYTLSTDNHQTLFNITQTTNNLSAFIKKYKVENAIANIIIDRPLATERICKGNRSDAQLHELIKEPILNRAYQQLCIGSKDHHYIFYVSSIAQSLLLQIKIIIQQLPLHLGKITTGLPAQQNLLKRLLGHTYNQAHCMRELDQQKARIERVFSKELLQRSLQTEHSHPSLDIPTVYALGTFFGTLS